MGTESRESFGWNAMAEDDKTSNENIPSEGERVIDISHSHARILEQLGLKEPGRMYRATRKEEIENIQNLGEIEAGSFFAPEVFKKYLFKPNENRGYVIEIEVPSEQLEKPQGTGVDPFFKSVYKQLKESIPLSAVTRIFVIEVLEKGQGKARVRYTTMYPSREELEVGKE